MGYSVKSIPFFSDAIELDVHTATYAQDLGHTAPCHFANGSPLRLEQVEETGEYIATRTRDGAFIQGQEI